MPSAVALFDAGVPGGTTGAATSLAIRPDISAMVWLADAATLAPRSTTLIAAIATNQWIVQVSGLDVLVDMVPGGATTRPGRIGPGRTRASTTSAPQSPAPLLLRDAVLVRELAPSPRYARRWRRSCAIPCRLSRRCWATACSCCARLPVRSRLWPARLPPGPRPRSAGLGRSRLQRRRRPDPVGADQRAGGRGGSGPPPLATAARADRHQPRRPVTLASVIAGTATCAHPRRSTRRPSWPGRCCVVVPRSRQPRRARRVRQEATAAEWPGGRHARAPTWRATGCPGLLLMPHGWLTDELQIDPECRGGRTPYLG